MNFDPLVRAFGIIELSIVDISMIEYSTCAFVKRLLAPFEAWTCKYFARSGPPSLSPALMAACSTQRPCRQSPNVSAVDGRLDVQSRCRDVSVWHEVDLPESAADVWWLRYSRHSVHLASTAGHDPQRTKGLSRRRQGEVVQPFVNVPPPMIIPKREDCA